jgi:hypothetical protein
MSTDCSAGHIGISRPRVIVSVTATADGHVTLSRMERLLDEGPNLRWKATWPPLETGSLPEQLPAIDVRVGAHGGTIWAHYEVLARCSPL